MTINELPNDNKFVDDLRSLNLLPDKAGKKTGEGMKEVIAKLNELEGKLEVKIQMTNDKLSNEIAICFP